MFSSLVLASQALSSLRQHSLLIGLLGRHTISKQALHQRLGPSASCFLREVLARLLACSSTPRHAVRGFSRVLVQDSTCWALPSRLRSFFPGPANGFGQRSGVRVQSIYDLRNEQFLRFGVSAFTRNDQSASRDILPCLLPGDLVLRDLAYFSLPIFSQIASAGAFFLSRIIFNVGIYSRIDSRPLCLLKLLRPDRPVDLLVNLGPNRLPVRLIAFPLPPQLVNQRRRTARAHRNHRHSYSALYYRLLAWQILVTNAPASKLPLKHASQLYALRWRIESIFKSWKSSLGSRGLGPVGPTQVEPLLYALLILAVILHTALFPSFPTSTHPPFKPLSLLKFADFFSLILPLILFRCPIPASVFSQQILAHCRYESRSRPTFLSSKSLLLP